MRVGKIERQHAPRRDDEPRALRLTNRVPHLGHDRVAWSVAQRSPFGGLAEWGTLRHGPRDAIVAEVRDAIRQTEGTGLIVAPGCVLPLDLPDAHLDVVVAAVKEIGIASWRG